MGRETDRLLNHFGTDSVAEAVQGLLLSEEQMTNRIDVEGFSFSKDLGVDCGRMRRISCRGFNSDDYRRFKLSYYGTDLGIVVFRLFKFQDMDLIGEDALFPSGWNVNLLVVGTGTVAQQDLSMAIELDRCLREDEHYRTEFFLDHVPAGAIRRRHRKGFLEYLHDRAPYLFDDEGSIILGKIVMGMALSINDDVIVELLLRCAIVAYYEGLFESKSIKHPIAMRKSGGIVRVLWRRNQNA